MVLVSEWVVEMVLSHKRRWWTVNVQGELAELVVAENVGGKWDPLGGCGGESECEGVLQYLLLA